ncbi:MAG TPA: DUF1743 domain-containing protein [Thermoplasmata archaeon]|nr:DUF1743 domain-containing protein [Thermoplasmata archaeon]
MLTELLRGARAEGIDLLGEPRLVRLNPNIPWKTRGNAALAARFGHGTGPRRRLGEIDGAPVWSFPAGAPLAVADAWADRAWRIVREAAESGAPGTDPALVASRRLLPSELYWDAVREVVSVGAVRAALERSGAIVRTLGSDRGIVGAAAAIAWRGRHPTWELIAYRSPARYGRPRSVSRESVRRAVREVPGLFLCEDPRTRRLMVAPHTACPILFGLRGTRRGSPLAARRLVQSEPVDRWTLFRTNQGSGDHLRIRAAGALGPYRSGIVRGRVSAPPARLPGGHVRFAIVDASGTALDCLAFEPTKTLPPVARDLVAGDSVRVWGSRGADTAFRLEGIEIVRRAPRFGRPRPPRCADCERTSTSLGRQRGFRCPGCHRRWPPEAAIPRPLAARFAPGVYHPTPSARRHLAPRGPEP